jgi:hypothetical protein
MRPPPNLEWLQEPPRRRSSQALHERIERIDFLKALRIHDYDLAHIPHDTLRRYAAALWIRRPAHLRKLHGPTRELRLVCFLRFTLMHTTDTAILLAGRHIAKIVREAYEKARLVEAEQRVTQRDLTQRIFAALEDASLSDGQFRDLVRRLKHTQTRPSFSSRAAATRWLLSNSGTPIRALLSELRKLALQSDGSAWTGQALARLTTLCAADATQLPEGHSPTGYPKSWRTLLEGDDRGRAHWKPRLSWRYAKGSGAAPSGLIPAPRFAIETIC